MLLAFNRVGSKQRKSSSSSAQLYTIPTTFPMLCSLPVNGASAQHLPFHTSPVIFSPFLPPRNNLAGCGVRTPHPICSNKAPLQTSRISGTVLPCLSIRPMSPIPHPHLTKQECLSPLSFLQQRSKQLGSSHFPQPSLYLSPE